ncbi:hypothetical protein [Streptomyces sp. R41]|uniref:DUF4328 domain-containing protein n=1 Tax=Streptomyces sp. R41 TaxID=3238632 RepID=A0AB39RF55_9ACTN
MSARSALWISLGAPVSRAWSSAATGWTKDSSITRRFCDMPVTGGVASATGGFSGSWWGCRMRTTTPARPAVLVEVAAVIRRFWAPLLVNLLIGVPAIAVMLCARWYAAYGHCGLEDLDRTDLDGCTYDQIDHSGGVLGVLVVTGAFVLLLVLIFDVFRPLSRGHALKPRLLTLPAVLLPYVLLGVAKVV